MKPTGAGERQSNWKQASTSKEPGRDGSFHDSGRNAGVGQGLNHSRVGSFHEIRQQELRYKAAGTVAHAGLLSRSNESGLSCNHVDNHRRPIAQAGL